jgi:FkbM family methyltransferase
MTISIEQVVTGFVTKKGTHVSAAYRENTSDWNTLSSCLDHDEYGFAEREWTGTALDVGAHIGGATLALLVDNPGLRMIAVEALPANVALLRENLARNGVADRCEVIEGAADCGIEPVTVAYGVTDSPFAAAHQFIGGNVYGDAGPKGERVTAQPISLTAIVAEYGPLDLAKIDCEGCEWSFLDDIAVAEVAEFRGEYHPTQGHTAADLRALLERTHAVTLDDATNFGPFRAVRL